MTAEGWRLIRCTAGWWRSSDERTGGGWMDTILILYHIISGVIVRVLR